MKLLALLSIVVLFSSCGNSQSNADRHFGSDTSNLQPGHWEMDTDSVLRFYTPPANYVPYFTQGQILLPDYACQDTLIVRDAVGLNKAMGLVEHGISGQDYGDSQLDSLFHAHCDYYVGSFEDQCSKLKVLQPTLDSLQIVTAIKED